MYTYKRYEAQDCLWIIECDSDYEWDGTGYPVATRVWQCRLDNEQELPAYRALWDDLLAEAVKEAAEA